MKPSPRSVFVLLVTCVVLVACGGNPGTVMDEVPSQQSTTTNVPTATLPAAPTLAPTSIPSPSPTATLPPLPEVIAKDTLSNLQVVRAGWLDAGLDTETKTRVVSPDARLMAVWGCYRDTENTSVCALPLVAILDMETGRKLFELEALTTIVEVMQFSPDGSVLALAGCHTPIAYYGSPETSCTEPRVWLVDTSTGEITHELKSFASAAVSLVFSPDGSKLYTSVFYFKRINYSDNSIRIWDVASGEELGEIHPDIINCTEVHLGISPDGHYLVTRYYQACTGSQQVKWWDLVNPSSRAVAGYPGVRFAVSPDSTKLAVLEDWENIVFHIYDLKSGNRLQVITPGVKGFSDIKFSFTPDSRALLLTNHKNTNGKGFAVIDISNGKILADLKPADYELWPLSAYAFSPDGSLLFTFGFNKNFEYPEYIRNFSAWDTSTWQEFTLPPLARNQLQATEYLMVSPDQKRVVNWGWTGDYAQLGFPVREQQAAQQALVTYLDLLSAADYSSAAKMISPNDEYFLPENLSEILPGVDLEDVSAILENLCQDPDFPCLPLLEVTYQSQIQPDTFLFKVQFANPDGTPAMWPPCNDAPLTEYCDWRNDFEYMVVKQSDGQFKIFNSPPYSLYLE